MTEEPAAEQAPEEAAPPAVAAPPVAEDADEATDAGGVSDAAEEPPPARTSTGRRWGFAVVRAIVVLGAAAVAYQFVVPQTHVERGRLVRLVAPTTGVKAFSGQPANQSEQPPAQLGIAALKTASQKSPNQTGVYTKTWQPSATQAGAIYAFLLPNDRQATTTLNQITAQQLSADAFSSNGLTRKSTFTVPGLRGSAGSLYAAAASQSSPATQLALVAFQEGKTLGVTEVAQASGAQADAITMAKTQAAHLTAVQGGFTLNVVTRSLAATIGWAAGAVVLAALIGFGPLGWRALASRRQRRIQEQLEHQVRVGGQVIMKRRV